MIELPESFVLANQLNATIQGKIIRYAKANQSAHRFAFYHGDPQTYETLLMDQCIQRIDAKAGHVVITLDNYKLSLSDGACIRYYEDYRKVSKKNQLYLEFEDDTALCVTIQMYACIFLFQEESFDNPYYLGACQKTSPLSKDFTYDYFKSLRLPKLENKSVKAFLATEQRIPGLGNGVLQDILYLSGIHPKRKLETISEEEYQRLYDTIVTLLPKMAKEGGRDTEKDLFGNYGSYMTYLSKKTYDQPCSQCGYPIHKESYMGGTIYYCEHCQH